MRGAGICARFHGEMLELDSSNVLVNARLARCLTKNMTSVCPVHGKFLKMAMLLGILIFRYLMFLYFIHPF